MKLASKHFCPYCMTPVREGDSCPTCGLTSGNYTPLPHHIPPGTVLADRYMIGRVLGEGGFGITYIGCDLRLELKVAIKEYFPTDKVNRHAHASLEVVSYTGVKSGAYEEGKERFLYEARTMARMDKQPAIVSVRDFFEANNTAYIVMEYVEGTTFKELVKQKGGRIGAGELLHLMEPLFFALGAFHAEGLIHRDISPDNLMLENGAVRLLDFGCARETSNGDSTLTIALKHGYAPIEQYQCKGQGPWTDVYGLCATIYYCLTGKAPPRAMDRMMEDELILPRKLGVDLTEAQERALLHGLGIRPKRRFQSMDELYAALYTDVSYSGPVPEPDPDFLAGSEPGPEPGPEPDPGPEPTVLAEEKRSGRTQWLIAGAAAALALVVLACAAAFYNHSNSRGQSPPAPTPAVQNVDFSRAAHVSEESSEAELRSLLQRSSAIVLDPGCYIGLGEELEIKKPILISEGACLYSPYPITVSGEGLLQVEGRLESEGLLRTCGGGAVRVGATGSLWSCMIWLERESDLVKATSTSVDGNEPICLDEETLFADAVRVTSAEEYLALGSSGAPVIIDGDVDLSGYSDIVAYSPVLIREGAALTTPVNDDSWNYGNGGNRDFVLINHGTYRGTVRTYYRQPMKAYSLVLVNYGAMELDSFHPDNGAVINYGQLTTSDCTLVDVTLGNLGDFRFSGYMNIKRGDAYNSGVLTAAAASEEDSSILDLSNSVRLRNSGQISLEENGGLRNQAYVINLGSIAGQPGSGLENQGVIECARAVAALEMPAGSWAHQMGVILYEPHHRIELTECSVDDDGGKGKMACLDFGALQTVSSASDLQRALAAPEVTAIRVDGDIAVGESVTVANKTLYLDGELHLAGGLTMEGENALLVDYPGGLHLNGGGLTLRDHALALCCGIWDCGGISLESDSTLALWGDGSRSDYGSHIETELSTSLISLDSMVIKGSDVDIAGIFRSKGDLAFQDCSIDLEGEILHSDANIVLDDKTRMTIGAERGVFELGNWQEQLTQLQGSIENHGWMELQGGLSELSGRLVNHGTLVVRGEGEILSVTGTLDNLGSFYNVDGAEVRGDAGTMNAGSYASVDELDR